MSGPISSHPWHFILTIIFFYLLNLKSLYWYVIVVLIFIVFMFILKSCAYLPSLYPLQWIVFSLILSIFKLDYLFFQLLCFFNHCIFFLMMYNWFTMGCVSFRHTAKWFTYTFTYICNTYTVGPCFLSILYLVLWTKLVKVMEFQWSYSKSWNMMLWKCCTQYVSKFAKLSSGHRTGKGPLSFQSQRKAMPKNAQTTTQLHSSHTPVK